MASPSNEVLVSTNGTSPAEIKEKLFQKFRSKGLLDTLKSQLRNHLIHELTSTGQHMHGAPSVEQKKPFALKLTNSLVIQHLQACQYDYTLSVFLPECGLAMKEVISAEEASHYIRLEYLGGTEANDEVKSSVLARIVSAVPKRKMACESGTQTDRVAALPGAIGFIDEKFSAIDDHFSEQEGDLRKSGRLQIEERLLGYQRQMDKMAADHIARETERFQTTTLVQMRAEERHACQLETEKRHKEMEATFNAKVSALQDRERVAFEKLQKDYELMGQETYRQRQLLLKQIDELRLREADLRKQQEHSGRDIKFTEDRLKKMDDLLHSREMALVQKEQQFDMLLKFHTDKIQSEEKDKYESKYKELHNLQSRLRDEEQRLRLQQERLLSGTERQELAEKRQRVLQLDALLAKYERELSAADINARQLQERHRQTIDYDSIREANLLLKADHDNVKYRLAEVLKENEKLRERHDRLLNELSHKASSSSPDLLVLKLEMERLKDMAVQDKVIAEARLMEMQARLQAQVDKNKGLVVEYERQTESMREMNRLVGQSQVAAGSKHSGHGSSPLHQKQPLALQSEVSAIESRLGAEWVPYPLDAASCIGGINTRRDNERGMSSYGSSSLGQWQRVDRGQEADKKQSDDWRDGRRSAPGDISQSTSEDNTTSDSLVEDTRRRLQGLENEAERLQQAMQSFSTAVSPGDRHVSFNTNQYEGARAVPSADTGIALSGHTSAFSRYKCSSQPETVLSGGPAIPCMAKADHDRRDELWLPPYSDSALARPVEGSTVPQPAAGQYTAPIAAFNLHQAAGMLQQQPERHLMGNSLHGKQDAYVSVSADNACDSGRSPLLSGGSAIASRRELSELAEARHVFSDSEARQHQSVLSSHGDRLDERFPERCHDVVPGNGDSLGLVDSASSSSSSSRRGADQYQQERLKEVKRAVHLESDMASRESRTAENVKQRGNSESESVPREPQYIGLAKHNVALPGNKSPPIEISLDNAWRSGDAVARPFSDRPSLSRTVSPPAATACSEKLASVKKTDDTTTLLLPATASASVQHEETGGSNPEVDPVMHKYMQMMQQQQRPQDQVKEELDDEIASLSLAASEKSKTEDDQDASENSFW